MKLTIWKLRRAFGLTWDTSQVPWWMMKTGYILCDAVLEEAEARDLEDLFLYWFVLVVVQWFVLASILDLLTAPFQYWLARRWKKQREVAEKTAEALRAVDTITVDSFISVPGVMVPPGGTATTGWLTVKNLSKFKMYVGSSR